MESVMGGVRMGVNVDIKRTDGKKELLLFFSVLVYIICVMLLISKPKQRPCVGCYIRYTHALLGHWFPRIKSKC